MLDIWFMMKFIEDQVQSIVFPTFYSIHLNAFFFVELITV